MGPTKEYLDYIGKRLESLNPGKNLGIVTDERKNRGESNMVDWLGQSATNYLKNKKDPEINQDPLFPDRNTY